MSNTPPEPPDPWQPPEVPPTGQEPVSPLPPPPGYPPPPPGYPPAGYQAPPPGYGQPPGYPSPGGYQPGYGPRNSGTAVAVLVLGICGLVFGCAYGVGIVPAIVALALAPKAKREIAGSSGMLTGEGMVKAGVICGWVTVGLTALGIVLVIALVLGTAANAAPLALSTTPTTLLASLA